MQSVFCLLLTAVMGLSASNLNSDAVTAPLVGTPTGARTGTPPQSGTPALSPAFIGTIDTIGGTTFDWQTNGPIYRMLANSPGYGIHAVWMYSTETSGTTFPDRNMRYNYYDFTTRAWNWIDPDYMQSALNVFPHRAGYGSINADPTSGAAIVGCHYSVTGGLTPEVARDVAPGAGIFEYADGEPVLGICQWPPISVSQNGTINIFPITVSYVLSYSHIAAGNWPTFDSPLTPINPSPSFPTQNIAASKQSGKVCLVWEISADDPQDAHMQTSTNCGATWTSPAQIPTPTAYGGDTLTGFHIASLFPFYDSNDRLNIVANLCPEVNDTAYINPSQIWHYCPSNNPQWNRVHVAGCAPAHLQASVGYNATYACRPSIGQDDEGDLFVAWEQFDSANVEPTTSRLRADIWAAGSTDGGVTWSTALKLTTAGTASCRFPCISDLPLPGDSLMVTYEMDQCAGFYVQGEGPATYNPIIAQKFSPDTILHRSRYHGALSVPNGGERWVGGDTQSIRWSVSPPNYRRTRLLLSTNGGSTYPQVVAESLPPGDTLFRWAVPRCSVTTCRVKSQALDSSGAVVFEDASNANFTIRPGYQGALLVPNGGQRWASGDTQTIEWRIGPKIFFYGKLLLSTNGGSTFPDTIAPWVSPVETTYRWSVSRYNSATCRVKYQAYDSSAMVMFQDASDNNFTIDADAPPAPVLLSPANGSVTNNPSVVFRWRHTPDVSGVSHYTLQVAYDSSFAVLADTARLSDTTYPRLLAADTVYYWHVRATDSCGHVGQWSGAWRFEIDAQAPGEPSLLEPAQGAWFRASTVVFSWTQVSFDPKDKVAVKPRILSPVRYVLQADSVYPIRPSPLVLETLAVTADTLSFLAEHKYWWRVKAYDLAGNPGQFSDTAGFGIDVTRPELPHLSYPPDLGNVDTNTVYLAWHPSYDNLSGIEFYHVQMAWDSFVAPDTIPLETPTPSDTSVRATLPSPARYFWRAQAMDRAGNWSNWSPIWRFTYSLPGVEEEGRVAIRLEVSKPEPNPFTQATCLRFVLPRAASVEASLFNAAGRRLKTLVSGHVAAGEHTLRWDGTADNGRPVQAGVYYLRTRLDDEVVTRQLIRSR